MVTCSDGILLVVPVREPEHRAGQAGCAAVPRGDGTEPGNQQSATRRSAFATEYEDGHRRNARDSALRRTRSLGRGLASGHAPERPTMKWAADGRCSGRLAGSVWGQGHRYDGSAA